MAMSCPYCGSQLDGKDRSRKGKNMTTYEQRPHLTTQQRFMELLALAEEYNAGTIFLGAVDFHVLQQCTPSGAMVKDATGRSILVYGRKFQLKVPAKPPHGILDLTGAEPVWET